MSKEMEILYSELFEAAGTGRRIGEEIASLAGQTQARWQTLWTIGTTPLTVPQISRRLGVSRQHILRLTNDLADERLVELIANPDHKTSPLVNLTPAGQEILAAINAAAATSNDAIEREFTPERVNELRTLLRRFTTIAKNIEPSAAGGDT